MSISGQMFVNDALSWAMKYYSFVLSYATKIINVYTVDWIAFRLFLTAYSIMTFTVVMIFIKWHENDATRLS